MRKQFLGVLLVVALITIGCGAEHPTERPFNYPPAKWVSDVPDISFIVSEEKYAEWVYPPTDDYILDGELNVGGKTTGLEVFFNGGNQVYFYDKEKSSQPGIRGIDKYDYVLIEGDCTFGPEELIVEVNEKTDKVFDGKYEIITFDRIPDELEGNW